MKHFPTFIRLFDLLLIFTVFFAPALGFSAEPATEENSVQFSYPSGLTAADVENAAATIIDADILHKMEKLAGDEFLGREYGTPTGRAAAEYLAAELKSYGYNETTLLQEIPLEAYPYQGAGQNVLALLPGSDPELAKKVIILCAHYDHLGFRDLTLPKRRDANPDEDEPPRTRRVVYYGADDNASSVTLLLEVARALKKLPTSPKRSILFIFADGEEKGILGSRYWADNPTIPLADVELAINFDMNGLLNEKSQLYIFGTRTGERLTEWFQCENSEKLELVFPWSVLPRSDHAAFLPHKIPVSMAATAISPVYHTPKDTVEKINIPGINRVARFTLCAVTRMACVDGPISAFRPQWRQEKCPVDDESAGFFTTAP